MNSFQPEPHVAQQSRREKLRICPSLFDPPSHPAMFLSPPGVLDFASPGGEGINFLTNSSSGIHEGTGWIQNSIGGGALIQTPLFPSHLYSLKHPGLSSYPDLHFPSSQLYQNAFQDVVTSSSTTPCSWVDNTNELLLLNRQSQQWYGEGDYARMKGEGGLAVVPASGSSTQSLSLSLSSNPLPELQVAQFEDRFGQEDVMQASRASNIETSSLPYSKFLTSSVPGVVDLSAAPDPRHGLGPLGPFTGYAAVLKSSKFLKPAQQLLDQFCNMGMGLRAGSSNRDASAIENGSNGRRGHSGFSSSSLYGSTKPGGDGCVNPRPEVQQKKAKLLFMQEEVCKRYKQYHQQMQMVVSSFESIPGLSAATPYTSLVLKSVLKHFRCLKNAITDQLRHVSNLVSEEFMPSPGPSKGEASPRLKYIAESFRKEKAMPQNSLNFFDHCQPVWRPQRGLPERAVSVLRAWLFDHFLHPYPTDTDKHMLATQTGLSRNQVSNWFINARVRLWKPMVEEIHNLETKEMSGMDLNSSNRNGGKPGSDDRGRPSDQILESQSNKVMDPMLDDESQRAMVQWHRGKRSRVEECGAPASMDRSLMSLAAYPVGMEIGSLGPVSLTLGLRHNNEGPHFGSHMVHDFVG